MVTNKVTDWSQTNCIISTCSILITKVERIFHRHCIITKNVLRKMFIAKAWYERLFFCVAFLSTIHTKVNVHLITYNRLWSKSFRYIGKYKQFNVLFYVINEGIGCRKNLSRSLLVVITQCKQLLICFIRCDHRVSAEYDWIYV